MLEEKFWEQISSNIELPFEIEDVKEIESNCGSTWINLKNGSSFSITVYKCEEEDEK